jgi:hypothetical protein
MEFVSEDDMKKADNQCFGSDLFGFFLPDRAQSRLTAIGGEETPGFRIHYSLEASTPQGESLRRRRGLVSMIGSRINACGNK